MLYSSTTTVFSVSNEEYFINVEDISETPTEIKAYFPKLMPNIKGDSGIDTSIKLRIDKSIFANASECAVIQTPSIINGQNFITIKPFENERPNFRAKATLDSNGNYMVKKNNKFIATVLHGDIQNMYFTGRK